MSLRLITGGSGSGKSFRLFTDVIRQASEHPNQSFLIIVPEQFTMQTQKELVRLHPAHGILNIDILSFQRLAYRVFEETGSDRRLMLTETGKNLLLRRIAAGCREELTVLGSHLDRPGYISEVKSILSELAQYHVTPEQLQVMIDDVSERPLLQAKLQDILFLQQRYRDFMKEKFLTAEEIMDAFCEVADRSETIRNSIIVFDGFTGFTPVQQKAMRKILELSPQVRVTLTLDPSEPLTGEISEHELFCLSRKTIRILVRLAGEAGCEVLEPIILSGKEGRHAQGGALSFLEHNLFRYGKRKTFRNSTAGELSAHVLSNPVEEVRFAALTISRLIREQQLRYRQIAILTGDLSVYEPYIHRVFEEYHIPCFIDRTVPVLLNPCLELIRSLFDIQEYRFSYDSVLRLLRTGMTGIDRADADRMENYILALGIRGEECWKAEWTGKTARMQEGEAEYCNLLRQRLMENLQQGSRILRQSRAAVRDYAMGLHDLLLSFHVQEKLKEMEEQFRNQGEPEKEKEYRQIYGVIIHILDEAVALLGDETVERKEFLEILEAGFAEARVGIIPPGIDQVQAGDIRRSRLSDVKVLFFLGVNEGLIPKRDGRGGIVSELEREYLADAGMELAPTARDNSYIQRFYLYLSLTKPSERLYLSWCRSSGDGTAMRPSYLVGVLKKMFPDMPVTDETHMKNPVFRIVNRETGLSCLAECLRECRDRGQADPVVKELLAHYLNQPLTKSLMDAAFIGPGEKQISRETASLLYGSVLENSVTRLEQFAACSYAHFASYGLSLQEREIYQVQPADVGNIFHQVLERYAEKIKVSPYDWHTIPEEVQERFTDECVDEIVSEYHSRVFFASARNRYQIERIRRIARRSVWALQHQVKAGVFVPEGFEVSFQAADDLSAVNIALSSKESMRLRGRIDRIDLCEEPDQVYIKVIDYKSGSASFDLLSLYYGLQLQLVVYLNAAVEMQQRIHPDKQMIPAGIFYYRMKDPVLDGTHEMTPEEINEEILKKLKVNGLVNADPAVVERMDRYFTKSSPVIPVSRKQDGSWAAVSSVASQEQFEAMSGFVQEKLEELGRQILDGRIQRNPYRKKEQTACDYCEFADLCGFDLKIPGTAYRGLGELNEEDLWSRICGRKGENE